ncbi:MAG: hypothetical protein ACYTG5_14085 [Planctomycetota bacterium]
MAANLAAIFFLALFISPGSFSQAASGEFDLSVNVQSLRGLQVTFGASLVLLVANILYLVYGRRESDPLAHVVSDAPGGPLMVSREALENRLRQEGESLEEVTRLKVSIASGGPKRLRVHAQFHCPEGVSIQELSRKLRAVLEAKFGELVKLADGGKLATEIEFSGFSGKLAKRQAEEKVGSDEPGPFTGPKYPIDDEDSYEAKAGS